MISCSLALAGDLSNTTSQNEIQRRVVIGPHMSALFMNYDLVWFQIHEMLRIEGEGEEQVQDELQVTLLQQFDAGCEQLKCLLNPDRRTIL